MTDNRTKKPSITGFIPTEFVENVYLGIMDMDEAQADIENRIEDAHELMNRPIRDILNRLEDDDYHDEIEGLHDELIALMDRSLLFYCFALKNIEFMPHATARNKQRLSNDFSIIAGQYHDPDFLAQEIRGTIDGVFPTLNELRECFSRSTIKTRRHNAWHDDFAKDILRGRELTREDMEDRMEYQFFKQKYFPLGIFKTSEATAKWLETAIHDSAFIDRTFDEIRSGALQTVFPGFSLVEEPIAKQDSVENMLRATKGVLRKATHIPAPKLKRA